MVVLVLHSADGYEWSGDSLNPQRPLRTKKKLAPVCIAEWNSLDNLNSLFGSFKEFKVLNFDISKYVTCENKLAQYRSLVWINISINVDIHIVS